MIGVFNTFLEEIKRALFDNTFVKLILGNYYGQLDQLRQIHVRRILVKRQEKLSFTYRYKTKDIVKNFSVEEGLAQLHGLMKDGFARAMLYSTSNDTLLERKDKERFVLKTNAPMHTQLPSTAHDHAKKRLIAPTGQHYLHALNITDAQGKVFKNAQNKYKQINQYVSILRPLIDQLGPQNIDRVVDMGSGKGYLTFALYDFFTQSYGAAPTIIGIEYREDLVALCNQIAEKSHFKRLSFIQGSIVDYAERTDLLIALHACDTATDDAIYKGIATGASLIVVAPCCHKQVRREMEQSKTANELSFMTRHGIFMERQAEMVTDGLRALIMEYFGYSTKVFQFISDEHTAKNVMLVGLKRNQELSEQRQSTILSEIKAIKSYFGISSHYLETLLLQSQH